MSLPYSPHSLLPAPEPRTVRPPYGQFYETVSKHLVTDFARIMVNGIPINLDNVRKLEVEVDAVLARVDNVVQNNRYVRDFQKLRHEESKRYYVADQRSKMRLPTYYLKPFDCTNVEHRSYFMAEVLNVLPNPPPIPTDTLSSGIAKWTARQVAAVAHLHPAIQLLAAKTVQANNTFAIAAVEKLATYKAQLYNRSYYDKISTVDSLPIPPFNIGSTPQKQQFFEWLGIASEKVSKKTGEASWDRSQIERLNDESSDPILLELTAAMIEDSFGAIIKENFIPAFYEHTILHPDGIHRLHGSLNLFGAKTFRPTAQDPNLLNMPSTKSAYRKPVKKCFVTPPGFVVLTADYAALEDRVIASLTRDTNKCNIFLQNLDGHCLNAYGYFKDEIAQHMTLTGDTVIDVKNFYALVKGGHKELEDIRQKGKPATFGLSYGSYPPKVSATLKISLAAATAIFDSYHNELYPGITEYRENYILKTATEEGRIHLGLGCYMKTDNPRRDIRTLHNGTCQFWSILTLLTINKLHGLIDYNSFQDDIFCISTIYDSIYFIVREDSSIIKWLNDNLIETMCVDFMENQTIKNAAVAQIGYDWATLHTIPNNATTEQIDEVLAEMRADDKIRQ